MKVKAPYNGVAGPKNMPEGMDFWVDFFVTLHADAKKHDLEKFAAGYEASAAPYQDAVVWTFAVPSRKAQAFFEAVRLQEWCADVWHDDHAYSDGEYFDPARPAGERFLFGFAG